MTSTSESQPRSAEAVHRAAVMTHGKPGTIGPALERLEKVARVAGIELLLPGEEVEEHGVGEAEEDLTDADIAIVLGGDGTMLRALQRFLGTDIPVVGVNFGRVGFLASIQPNELESGLARIFSGDYRVVHLTTLEVEVDDVRAAAINDVVVLSSIKGRMVELAWAIGGGGMGGQPRGGVICARPPGPTTDNPSDGGA